MVRSRERLLHDLRAQPPLTSSMSGDRKSSHGGDRVERLNSVVFIVLHAASVLLMKQELRIAAMNESNGSDVRVSNWTQATGTRPGERYVYSDTRQKNVQAPAPENRS